MDDIFTTKPCVCEYLGYKDGNCEPGCKECEAGYYMTNYTTTGRCETCNLLFPHCETCERVFQGATVDAGQSIAKFNPEAPRCTGCDPMFVLFDGECVSDGIIEFESPRYHVYQDEVQIDVLVYRNLDYDPRYRHVLGRNNHIDRPPGQDVTIVVHSEDVTAKSTSLDQGGRLASFDRTNFVTTFEVRKVFDKPLPEYEWGE